MSPAVRQGKATRKENVLGVSSQANLVLVEDSPTQAARLKFILSAKGYTVRVANRGSQALELCSAEVPDLVVSDVTMPEMDGYEFCRRLKSDEKTRAVPVMLLTGLSDPKDIIYGLEAGADCYLTKPYSDDELANRIEFVIANASADAYSNQAEVQPIEVTFLGQTHTVTSTRNQILNLLLSTYESAARRNKQLDKEQLKMKVDLRDAKRRVKEAQDETEALKGKVQTNQGPTNAVLDALPLPAILFKDGQKVHASAYPFRAGLDPQSLDELRASGEQFEIREFQREDESFALAFRFSDDDANDVSPRMKRKFIEDLSTPIHEALTQARVHMKELQENVPSESRAHAMGIETCLSNLSALDILEWEALTYHLDLETIDLEEELETLIHSFSLQSKALRRGQTLRLESTEPAPIQGDRRRLKDATRALVDNALRFGPADSEVVVTLSGGPEFWNVTVLDSGSGFPLEIQENACEPFVSGRNGGLGLGLAYARTVARSHGGELNVEQLESGCAVTLKLAAEHL